MQIILGAVVCCVAKPADYVEEERTPYGIQTDEVGDYTSSDYASSEESDPESYHPAGVYTKYPDDPLDEYKTASGNIVTEDTRKRRGSDAPAESLASCNKTQNATAEPKPTITLQGLIDAVEVDLVQKAKVINTGIVKSPDATTTTTTKSTTQKPDPKDFFDEIDNSTKLIKRSDDKSAKIPLAGVVQAVESTLIHSAQRVRRDAADASSATSADETTTAKPAATVEAKHNESIVHVEHLSSSKSSSLLNVLGPISASSTSPPTTTTTTTTQATTAAPTPTAQLQQTNLTVVHTSNTIHIVPNAADNSLHIKHQQLQKTVFHSNLAIFPTIPPETINAPLPTGPPTTESGGDAATHAPDAVVAKKEQLPSKIERLEEKIAEIQADPVIVSQF